MSDKLVTNEMTAQGTTSGFDFGEHTKKRIEYVLLRDVKGAIIFGDTSTMALQIATIG